ncbi:hypothetical protein ACWD4B_20540 [Streptomyces sp. NPDC002536]
MGRSGRTARRPADARHAYTVLRGLTAASGGMVAAGTTSLPERTEEGRNYDYRYVCWPRSAERFRATTRGRWRP